MTPTLTLVSLYEVSVFIVGEGRKRKNLVPRCLTRDAQQKLNTKVSVGV